MMSYWTAEEKRIHHELCRVRQYPRWTAWSGGFIYRLHRNGEVLEEAFRYFDGTWSAGKEWKGTLKKFQTLPEALEYGRQQAEVKVRCYCLNQARYARNARKRLTWQATRLSGVTMDVSNPPAGITTTPLSLGTSGGGITVSQLR